MQYSTCFDDFSAEGSGIKFFEIRSKRNSANFTALVIETHSIEGYDLVFNRIERVFCEPNITLKSTKSKLLISSEKTNGKIPVIYPDVTLKIEGKL